MGSHESPRPVDVPRLVAIALLTNGPQVLLTQRPTTGPLPGLWEFPGGKVEFGEHPWEALRRELREELDLGVASGRFFGLYSHVYDLGDHKAHYVLVAYRVRVARSRIPEKEGRRWVRVGELRRWPVVPGSKPIVEDLVRRRRRLT